MGLAGSALPVGTAVTKLGELGVGAWTGYRSASAAYSLVVGAGTGAAIGGGLYTGGAAVGAFNESLLGSGKDFGSGFSQRFSYSGLGAAMTVGAVTGMYGTTMFRLAGVPNEFGNVVTLPGALIRVNGIAMGQGAGRAVQAVVNPSGKN